MMMNAKMIQAVLMALIVLCFGGIVSAPLALAADGGVTATPRYERVNKPVKRCWTETPATAPVTTDTATDYVGNIVGGIAGAILGNQVGKGDGKTAATAVGAVVGSIVGDKIAKKPATIGNGNGLVERCSMQENIVEVMTGYDVVIRPSTGGETRGFIPAQH